MQHLWLIPAFPLAGFVINGMAGRRLPRGVINAVAIGAAALSFAWALKCVLALLPIEVPYVERYGDWIRAGSLSISWEFMLDRLTAVMLGVVTFVGTLIHVYSVGYMAHDPGYPRFFSYLNLFMAFMLTLVLAANMLVMFVGWEGVGLCSYLLIGFWYVRRSATNAGNKAFIVNRIGDYGFTLAIFLTLVTFGSLSFSDIFADLGARPIEQGLGTLTIIAMLLLLGATGKSAQIPLYVWLPDAMEGPTPVSALIHAATMVTAGVYMIARMSPLYLHAPSAMVMVAWVGMATALFAAILGTAQTDIKKVYAYSTVSQLGFMFMGVGAGAFSAGIFHLFTHAFFKAVLFLGAGSVMHALAGEQDMRRMGGLRTKTPVTFWSMLAASAAIAALPWTSGFFSKDEILLGVHALSPVMFWLAVVTAAITSFYVFRAIFLVFFGAYRGDVHAHESPWVMLGPVAVLAGLALGGGFIPVPEFLEPVFGRRELHHAPELVIIGSGAGIVGLAVAFFGYWVKPGIFDPATDRLFSLTFVFDKVYSAAIVRPVVDGSRAVLWRAVDAAGIDGFVNGVAARARGLGSVLRLLQSGNIRSYAAWVLLGSVGVLLALGVAGGLR